MTQRKQGREGTPGRRRFLHWSAVWALAPLQLDARGQSLAVRAAPHIERLLQDMSLEDMAGQLSAEGAWSPRLALSDFFAANPFMEPVSPEAAARLHAEQLARVRAGAVGILMGPMDLDTVEQAQRAAIEQSRWGIPLLFAADVIHGQRTCFPIPLAEAASWEPELAQRTSRALAIESTARGIDLTFAPMVDVGRDQRWGRVAEGAGEDVLLGRRFAAARVRGFQDGRPGAADSLLACPKHFVGYGAVEAGMEYAAAAVTERQLREVYLPPFQAAYEAGALATMSSFNTVDGAPVTGSHRLLTGLLREELGFPGMVISDYDSARELIQHGVAADDADAARQALAAGCDVDMSSGIYLARLPELVRQGRVPREMLAEAVRRVLRVKAAAGLFEDPLRRVDRRRYERNASDAAHRALAREAATRSIVLLKNEQGLLPLQPDRQRIALIGPFARNTADLNGPWGPMHVRLAPVSLEEGLRERIAGSGALRVVDGAEVEQPWPGGIIEATEAARWADVVVLALGESQAMSGEAASRTQIVVPSAQQALAEAVAAVGKPMVVVLRNGRALALRGAVRDAAAIVVGWFLGTETGHGLADVLCGLANPGGRLPVSFPIDSGQEPYYYARPAGGRPAPAGRPLESYTSHYRNVPDAPLYPFGHGIGYAPIEYGAVQLDAPQLAWDGELTVHALVSNRGSREAEEVVQLYVHDVVASLSRPVRELKDFRKVRLAPGESRAVAFTVRRQDLGFLGADLRPTIEPGAFDVWIAPNARAGEPVRFDLLPPP